MGKPEWISANEAAEIVSANNGRTVIPQYIRDLAQRRKIQYKPIDGRTNVYLRSDVEKIRVRRNKRAKEDAQEKTTKPSEQKPVTEEQPWYMSEQKEENEQIGDKSEPSAA